MSKGWISLHRKILDNPVLTRSRTYSRFEAFVYMLLKANHKDNKVLIGNQLIKVNKGSFITSQKQLMIEFNWGTSRLRNFLELLKKDKMIEINSNAISTLITINNYSELQGLQTDNKPIAKRKQTDSKLIAKTNNNENNENNENNDNKEQEFINQVLAEGIKITPMVAPDIIDDFCNYWTERNVGGTKMKYEMEKTFDIKRRLNRWLKNQKDWNVNTKKPVVGFKTTTSGHYIGYCATCNESSFYKEFNLRGDSICCSAEIKPERKE
tara:strand:+ start:1144 stop:1944 length:801 start_codon:yes stop_codon:yes gene_type:complete